MKKVGSITTAVGLLALGLLLLVEQLYPGQSWASNPLQWWPLLLIGLGVEILYRRSFQKYMEMKIDPLLLIFLAAVFSAGIYSHIQVQLIDHGVFGWKYTLTRSYEVGDAAAGIKSLEVRCPDGEVILAPSTNGEFRVQSQVTVNSNQDRDLPDALLKLSREGERLLVTCEDSSWHGIRSRRQTTTSIELPPGIPLRVDSRSGELSGQGFDNPLVVDKEFGKVDLSNLGGTLTIRSRSGEVDVREIRGDTIIRLTNGEVQAEQVAGIQAALESGNINIIEGKGTIDARSQSGTITVDNPQGLSGDCRLNTESGTIELSAGKLENCHLTASTGTGQVIVPTYLEQPEYRTSTGAGQMVEASVGRGERTIDLFSRQGSVTVR